jgi:organic hydroperoxide reductase OsmC/OhrA
MSSLPKIFKVESFGDSGIDTNWLNSLSENKACTPIVMAIPPEFEGPGGTYSPEDLYALSLLNCYLATFKVIAAKSKLEFKSIHGTSQLSVDKNNGNLLWMARAEMSIVLKGVDRPDRALNLLKKTKAHCMIINSVNTEIIFHFSIAP